MSLMNKKKSLLAAITAAALMLILVGGTILNSQKQERLEEAAEAIKHEYVVAINDINKGSVIKEEDVIIKNLPMEMENTYTASGEVIGRTASTDIKVGQPLLKDFIEAIQIVEKKDEPKEPKPTYRAVPILVKKSSLPPYISIDSKFDLLTKENTMKIENLRILNVLDPTKDENNKMLILEIENKDVEAFVKYQVKTKGFIFLQKNPKEYDKYKFYDLEEERIAKEKIEQKKALDEMARLSTRAEAYIPPAPQKSGEIPKIEDINSSSLSSNRKGVEVIIGNTKSTVEF